MVTYLVKINSVKLHCHAVSCDFQFTCQKRLTWHGGCILLANPRARLDEGPSQREVGGAVLRIPRASASHSVGTESRVLYRIVLYSTVGTVRYGTVLHLTYLKLPSPHNIHQHHLFKRIPINRHDQTEQICRQRCLISLFPTREAARLADGSIYRQTSRPDFVHRYAKLSALKHSASHVRQSLIIHPPRSL